VSTEDLWVGYGYMRLRQRWVRLCGAPDMATAARRLRERARLLKLTTLETRLTRAGEGPPDVAPGAAVPGGAAPWKWGRRAGPAPTNGTSKAGKRGARRGRSGR
jgi:hypothetical protein